jgi:hypothetical protein
MIGLRAFKVERRLLGIGRPEDDGARRDFWSQIGPPRRTGIAPERVVAIPTNGHRSGCTVPAPRIHTKG